MYLKRIAALVVVGLFSLPSAGCTTDGLGATISSGYSAFQNASQLTIDPKYMVISANVALGMQSTAKNYLRLKRCNGANGPICRDPVATPEIGRAVLALRKARKAATSFVIAHPNQLGPSGLYDALQVAIASATDIFTKYNVTGITPPVVVNSGALPAAPLVTPLPPLAPVQLQ